MTSRRRFLKNMGLLSAIVSVPSVFIGGEEIETTDPQELKGGPISFRVNGVERMRIYPDGLLGFGTTSPSAKMMVVGTN